MSPESGSRAAGCLRVMAFALVVGVALTFASTLVRKDLNRSPDGFHGDATVYGAPLAYYYTVREGDGLMARQVYCVISPDCEDGPEFLPKDPGQAASFPFLLDWAFWSALSIVPLTILQLIVRVHRRRRHRPAATERPSPV